MVEGCCASLTSTLHTLVNFNTKATDDNNVSFLHRGARRITMLISSNQYPSYQECNPNPAKSNYQIVAVVNRTITYISKSLHNEPLVPAAGESSLTNL